MAGAEGESGNGKEGGGMIKNILILPEEFLPLGFPKICLYRLFDPFTKEVCYVGRTDNPQRRLGQYCQRPGDMKNSNAYLTRWLADIWDRDGTLIMEVVATCEHWEADKREAELIAKHWERGCPLLNRRPRRRGWGKRMSEALFNKERNLFPYFRV